MQNRRALFAGLHQNFSSFYARSRLKSVWRHASAIWGATGVVVERMTGLGRGPGHPLRPQINARDPFSSGLLGFSLAFEDHLSTWIDNISVVQQIDEHRIERPSATWETHACVLSQESRSIHPVLLVRPAIWRSEMKLNRNSCRKTRTVGKTVQGRCMQGSDDDSNGSDFTTSSLSNQTNNLIQNMPASLWC